RESRKVGERSERPVCRCPRAPCWARSRSRPVNTLSLATLASFPVGSPCHRPTAGAVPAAGPPARAGPVRAGPPRRQPAFPQRPPRRVRRRTLSRRESLKYGTVKRAEHSDRPAARQGFFRGQPAAQARVLSRPLLALRAVQAPVFPLPSPAPAG